MPVGWSMRTKRTLTQVKADACEFIQTMNDRYTKPSGANAQMENVSPETNQGAAVETLKAVSAENSQ